MATSSPLLHLSAGEVESLLPPVADRIALARRAMAALVADAELPPKLGVHPRPAGSFGHAMPALLRGADPAGSEDLVGLKWVMGYGGNAAHGLPAIHGTVVLNDAMTGVPTAILDAGPITAHRTAAVTGVAVERFRGVLGEGPRVALLGGGVQGRSHVPVLGHVVPGARLLVHDRHPERAEAVAAEATRMGAFGSAGTADSMATAVRDADLVVTVLAFGAQHGILDPVLLEPARLVVAVDYDTCVPATYASRVARFVVDETGQFRATREAGSFFAGYRDPDETLGEALLRDAARGPRDGGEPPLEPHEDDAPVLVTHLGVGLADLVFGEALRRAALERGVGTALPRG